MASRRVKVVLTIIAVLCLISLGLLQTGMFAQDEGGPPADAGGPPADAGGPPGGGPGGPPGGGPGGPPGAEGGAPGAGAAPAAPAASVGLPEPPLDAAYPQLPEFKPAANMTGGMVAGDVQQWCVRTSEVMRSMRDAENAEIRAMVGPADRTRWPDAKPAEDPKAVNKPIWSDSLNEAVNLRNQAIGRAASSSGGYDATRMAQVRDFNANRARLDTQQTPWVGLDMMRSLIDPWYATVKEL